MDLHVQIIQKRKTPERLLLPTSTVRLLFTILDEMSERNAVALIPVRAELTMQEAADVLNVSSTLSVHEELFMILSLDLHVRDVYLQ